MGEEGVVVGRGMPQLRVFEAGKIKGCCRQELDGDEGGGGYCEESHWVEITQT